MLEHAVYANNFDYEREGMSLPLRSSNLCCITWHDDLKELVVHFVNGLRYRYYGVPRYLVRNMLTAPSAGHFFAYRIRNKYVYSKEE